MVSHVEWKPGSNSMLVPRFSFLFAWHVVLTFLQLYLTVQKATYSEVQWLLRDSNSGLEAWNIIIIIKNQIKIIIKNQMHTVINIWLLTLCKTSYFYRVSSYIQFIPSQ